jgi:hypothetical protein
MFLNELPPGKVHQPFDDHGASCVPLHDALNCLNSHKGSDQLLWDNNDLLLILPNSMNIRRIIYNILRCHFGSLFTVHHDGLTRRSRLGDEIVVPIMRGLDEESRTVDFNYGLIDRFMLQTGLRTYLMVDIEDELINQELP